MAAGLSPQSTRLLFPPSRSMSGFSSKLMFGRASDRPQHESPGAKDGDRRSSHDQVKHLSALSPPEAAEADSIKRPSSSGSPSPTKRQRLLDHKDTPQGPRASNNAYSGTSAPNPSSQDQAGPSSIHFDASRSGEATTMAKRASQACLRCRKQKLRCLGGNPCARCLKAKTPCEYGKPGTVVPRGRPSDGVDINHSLRGEHDKDEDDLNPDESRIASLLVDLRGTTHRGRRPDEDFQRQDTEHTERHPSSWSRQRDASHFSTETGTRLSSSTYVRPLEPPRFVARKMNMDNFSRHLSRAPTMGRNAHVSSSVHSSSGARRFPSELSELSEQAATDGWSDAPFKDLLYKQGPAQRSPPRWSRSSGNLVPYERKMGQGSDDPINTGIVDHAMGELLFQFFIENCHPFLPIVNIAVPDAFSSIRQSAPLFSAIIAVAARFYVRYVARMSASSDRSLLDPSAPGRLANLAETHLGSTLLRKQYDLSDVQATLILAAWGLQPGGRGPDAWVVTGHAARIARRLGVHEVLAHAAENSITSKPGDEAWERLEALLPQWRTWLGWFGFDGFLTLGFGRPQSTQLETVDETGFLRIRLNNSLPRPGSPAAQTLCGDVYVACQVQLADIGRDLVNWSAMLSDSSKAIFADPRRAEMFRETGLSLESMLQELNARLDAWFREWIWSGSRYTLYLGASARIARLQGEHMRLCINSYALRPGNDVFVAPYLRKALNAASSTIQTHFESSESDLALSFATDYLTITLAQAALFLIRLTKTSSSIQSLIGVSRGAVQHLLRLSTDTLDESDLSETRLSTHLAKTVRDFALASGLHGDSHLSRLARPPTAAPRNHEGPATDDPNAADSDDLDDESMDEEDMEALEAFMSIPGELNLGHLLGLGDLSGEFLDREGGDHERGAGSAEFGLGMDRMGARRGLDFEE